MEPTPIADLAPILEGSIAAAREMEALLLEREIPVVLAAKPAGACCGGGCGCGGKLRVMVRPADVERVRRILDDAWLESVRREGVVGDEGLVSLRSGPSTSDSSSVVDPCPACGHSGARTEGACSDCGLQLE